MISRSRFSTLLLAALVGTALSAAAAAQDGKADRTIPDPGIGGKAGKTGYVPQSPWRDSKRTISVPPPPYRTDENSALLRGGSGPTLIDQLRTSGAPTCRWVENVSGDPGYGFLVPFNSPEEWTRFLAMPPRDAQLKTCCRPALKAFCDLPFDITQFGEAGKSYIFTNGQYSATFQCVADPDPEKDAQWVLESEVCYFFEWRPTEWSACSVPCFNQGIQTREVTCWRSGRDGTIQVADQECISRLGPKDSETRSCRNEGICYIDVPSGTNLTLEALARQAGWNGVSVESFVFTLRNGRQIDSSTPSVSALRTGTFPPGTNITFVNDGGSVIGAGGRGGAAGKWHSVPAQAGQQGGSALTATSPMRLDNRGLIAGGGGGGGGGAGDSCSQCYDDPGTGGGGGAGVTAGAGGWGQGHSGFDGASGSRTSGGEAGVLQKVTGSSEWWRAGTGGRGGDLGQPGEPGGSSAGGNPGGAGGAAGSSIEQSWNVDIQRTGTLKGPLR